MNMIHLVKQGQKLILIFWLSGVNVLYAQPNCNFYKLSGDIKKYEACKAAEKREGHYQFSYEYQKALEDALAIDSSFSYAYSAMSTAYLKSGDFVTWMELMNKAVEYAPADHLDYRGWCRFQFFRDYEGAIEDIMRLKTLNKNHIGFSVNGDYHLDVALALCYKATDRTDEAILIMENKMEDSQFMTGLYDHLHLGVMYLEKGEYQKALEQCKLQENKNDLAENRFYAAIIYRFLSDEDSYSHQLKLAKQYYTNGKKMFDPYTEHIDKIFLTDITNEENAGFRQKVTGTKGYVLRRQ
jgi:tetratricopeptide (TPR) repeat protein